MALITEEVLDCNAILEAVRSVDHGAVCLFVGTVRKIHEGREVACLEYEAHPTMARKKLQQIEEQIAGRWPGVSCRIDHRVGKLALGEMSVVIAVGSPHRGEAFEACRFCIEALKKEVPIWKKETFSDGEVAWVDPTAEISGDVLMGL